jgi:hypothetical protein
VSGEAGRATTRRSTDVLFDRYHFGRPGFVSGTVEFMRSAARPSVRAPRSVSTRPTIRTDGSCTRHSQRSKQRARDTVIQDHPGHSMDRRASPGLRGGRRCVGVEGLLGELQNGHGVFAAYIRKIREKRIKGIAPLDLVDQRLNGNARAAEYRSAAEALR